MPRWAALGRPTIGGIDRARCRLVSLERTDNRLDSAELLLVLVHPVRSACRSAQVDLLEEVVFLTLELRQEVVSGHMVVTGETRDFPRTGTPSSAA